MEWIVVLLVILLIGMFISATSGRRLIRLYKKYLDKPTYINCTGLQLVGAVIDKERLPIKVAIGKDRLCDCYIPKKKILVLSPEVADTASVASIGVSMHELGHAIQDRDKNFWFIFSRAFNILARIFNFLVAPLVIAGIVIMIGYPHIFNTGVACVLIGLICWVSTFFVKVLLIPVEFGASRIAYKFLRDNRVLQPRELANVKRMLNAAAMTYVGSLFNGLLRLLGRR